LHYKYKLKSHINMSDTYQHGLYIRGVIGIKCAGRNNSKTVKIFKKLFHIIFRFSRCRSGRTFRTVPSTA
jgi:hypothetical protein